MEVKVSAGDRRSLGSGCTSSGPKCLGYIPSLPQKQDRSASLHIFIFTIKGLRRLDHLRIVARGRPYFAHSSMSDPSLVTMSLSTWCHEFVAKHILVYLSEKSYPLWICHYVVVYSASMPPSILYTPDVLYVAPIKTVSWMAHHICTWCCLIRGNVFLFP